MPITYAEALQHELPSSAVPGDVQRRARRFLDQIGAYLGFDEVVPDIRWLRRGAPVRGVFFGAQPGAIWVHTPCDDPELAEIVGHELRHLRWALDTVSSGRYDRPGAAGRDELIAKAFGCALRDRVAAGKTPLVDTAWPRYASLPTPSQRPPTTRSIAQPAPTLRTSTAPARPGVVTAPKRWQARRVPVTIAGKTCFTCRGCSAPVPVGLTHRCARDRFPLRSWRSEDDDDD